MAAAALCLYIFILHIIKRRNFTINRVFSIISLALFIQFTLTAAINIFPTLAADGRIIKTLIFIPFFIFAAILLISAMFPLGRLRKNLIPAVTVFLFIVIDAFFLFLLTPDILFDSSKGIPKSSMTAIQLIIIFLLMTVDPVFLLLRTSRHSMNRIRNAVLYYLGGVLFSYVLFITLYFSGYLLGGMTLLQNPYLSIPVIYILIITSYLLIDLRNNDFLKFYRETLTIVTIFAIYTVPAYFFLKFANLISIQPLLALLLKSAILFIWFVLTYRLFNPLGEYFKNRNLNRLTDEVNNILVPIHELRKITDMEKFWNFITKDNFQGLQKGFGIQSAYFMLINRKDKGYHFTYGFGPDLEPDFLSRQSIIVKQLSSYRGVFEKSYLLTDLNIADSEKEINEFFTKNNLEAAIPFRNMSDVVVGFLFLGSISGKKGFNSDILAALETFRIKLQNLLTTGLILDEVTADQVNDHDRIVVNTIKKRILPEELVSIPGIRISSLYINNSSMGGDYIDALKISKDSSAIFISDTSYSGIDSALIALQLYSILHSRTMVFNSAEKVLNTMNQVLKTSRISGSFVKSACVILSSDGNYTYSNASFNHMMIFDAETGKINEIETSGIPLGIEMNYRYTLTSAKLREGSIGFLYSDGLITSANHSGDIFSLDTVRGIIAKFAKQNPSIITREIYKEFKHFTDGKDLTNDISMIIFKKVKIADE